MPAIRKMISSDSKKIMEMMREFYTSPAVLTNGSEEIFRNDINECISESPFLEGYVFEDDGEILGYAMLAKSFSTEFGKKCIWLEDLYILPEYRSKGIGTKFFEYMEQNFSDAVIKLEVEEENEKAIRTYKKCGFEVLQYMEMKKVLK